MRDGQPRFARDAASIEQHRLDPVLPQRASDVGRMDVMRVADDENLARQGTPSEAPLAEHLLYSASTARYCSSSCSSSACCWAIVSPSCAASPRTSRPPHRPLLRLVLPGHTVVRLLEREGPRHSRGGPAGARPEAAGLRAQVGGGQLLVAQPLIERGDFTSSSALRVAVTSRAAVVATSSIAFIEPPSSMT
jgi:hypothetical protein